MVPLRDPRPAQGPEPGQRWLTARTPAESAPTAGFIETLRGPDAAFEVILGQGRLFTTRESLASAEGSAVIAVGDPAIVEFQVLPNPRMIRLTGRRAGVTDLSFTTAEGQVYTFEVHVVYDLPLLRVQLKQIFPDAFLKITQLRQHLVVEGQARSPQQITQIIETIESYLESVQASAGGGGGGGGGGSAAPSRSRSRSTRSEGSTASADTTDASGDGATSDEENTGSEESAEYNEPEGEASGDTGAGGGGGGSSSGAKVINLLKVPGVQQVMLEVKIAELNRTAARQMGADILYTDSGVTIGTNVAGGLQNAMSMLGIGGGGGDGAGATSGSVFGIFPGANFAIMLKLLRRNGVVTILAEPNIVALHGHQASFLAGGQYPVPSVQRGGGAGNTTVQYRSYGVMLDFVPYIMEDETIRLSVAPSVSSIDEGLATTLVPGGDPIPATTNRSVSTTVELREGQTLAIAGLLSVEMDGTTSRIPGLGDLPYIGSLFSNTTHQRVEKELLILVTPWLVRPMDESQVPPLPGDDITEPDDHELYLLQRIEGRTGRDHQSTRNWDDPLGFRGRMISDRRHVHGPVGFSN